MFAICHLPTATRKRAAMVNVNENFTVAEAAADIFPDNFLLTLFLFSEFFERAHVLHLGLDSVTVNQLFKNALSSS